MVTAVRDPRARLVLILLLGGSVAVALGVYGNVHDPTGRSLVSLVFSAPLNAKVWLATGAFTLALFQLGSSLRIYGKLRSSPAPPWLGSVHRISGTLAFVLTLVVAYHCLWSLGFQSYSNRVLIHGVVGCFFYGAFAAKVLIVRSKGLPGWALPVAGGVLFSALTVIWWTSSLWFFTTREFPGF